MILYLGTEIPETEQTVPNLYGLGYEQARELLAQRGLFLRSRSPLLHGEEQRVAYQSAAAGSSLPAGDVITVTLISADDSILGRY